MIPADTDTATAVKQRTPQQEPEYKRWIPSNRTPGLSGGFQLQKETDNPVRLFRQFQLCAAGIKFRTLPGCLRSAPIRYTLNRCYASRLYRRSPAPYSSACSNTLPQVHTEGSE